MPFVLSYSLTVPRVFSWRILAERKVSRGIWMNGEKGRFIFAWTLHFLGLLQQLTTNLGASNNRNVLPHSSGGQKSEIHQGVGRAALPPKALGEDPFSPLAASGGSRSFSPCGRITSTSTFIFTWSLCVCISILPLLSFTMSPVI